MVYLTEESAAQCCFTSTDISHDSNKPLSFIDSSEQTFKGLFVVCAQIVEPWVWCQVEWVFFKRKERIIHGFALVYCSKDHFFYSVIIKEYYMFINFPCSTVKRNLGVHSSDSTDWRPFEQGTAFQKNTDIMFSKATFFGGCLVMLYMNKWEKIIDKYKNINIIILNYFQCIEVLVFRGGDETWNTHPDLGT